MHRQKKFQVKNISKFKGFSRQIPSTLISFCLSAQPTPPTPKKRAKPNDGDGISFFFFHANLPAPEIDDLENEKHSEQEITCYASYTP